MPKPVLHRVEELFHQAVALNGADRRESPSVAADTAKTTQMPDLKLKLLPEERKAIEQRSTSNPEAYKLYLMARQYNATGNSRHRDITVRLCQRAVEIDPDYARAWALLANTSAMA